MCKDTNIFKIILEIIDIYFCFFYIFFRIFALIIYKLLKKEI